MRLHYFFNRINFVILRVLAFYPGVYWPTRAYPLYRDLQRHSLPPEIPHRRIIYISQCLSGVLVSLFSPKGPLAVFQLTSLKSIVLILWIVPSMIYVTRISTSKKGKKVYGLIIFCLIDWGMIALMVASLAWQSYYLPVTFSGCHKATTWQLTSDGTNLFSFMADSTCSKDSCSPKKKCHEFVQAEIVSIVMLSVREFCNSVKHLFTSSQYLRYAFGDISTTECSDTVASGLAVWSLSGHIKAFSAKTCALVEAGQI